MTLDDLTKINRAGRIAYSMQHQGAELDLLKEERAGIAAVVMALRDMVARSSYPLRDLNSILGSDAEYATSGASAQKGEKNELRTSTGSTKAGRDGRALRMERQGYVGRPATAGHAQQDDAVPVHRVPDRPSGLPARQQGAVVGVSDGHPRGRLADHGVSPEAAGVGVLAASGAGLSPASGQAPAATTTPDVCVWTHDAETSSFDAACKGKWVQVYSGTQPAEEGYNYCPTCGKPVQFQEAAR